MSQVPCETYSYSKFRQHSNCPKMKFSWWFQASWIFFVKLDHFPKDRGENKKYLKFHHLEIRAHLLQRQLVALPSILHPPRFCSPSHPLASPNAPWSRYVVEPPPQVDNRWRWSLANSSQIVKLMWDFGYSEKRKYMMIDTCIWHK